MKRTSDMPSSTLQKVALVERNPDPGGVSLVNSAAVAKKSPNDLVELAKEIQKAETFVHATACSKLKVIVDQVRFLQQEAQKILLEAKVNSELHHVACNFIKVPGHIYHLYERSMGQKYFGMLSPEEWQNCPHKYLGSYRLEPDHSWTPIEETNAKDDETLLINKILSTSNELQALNYSSMDTS